MKPAPGIRNVLLVTITHTMITFNILTIIIVHNLCTDSQVLRYTSAYTTYVHTIRYIIIKVDTVDVHCVTFFSMSSS